MLRNGTARRSDSSWASPLYLVSKKEDVWGPCGDYRAMKATTVPDQYPVRHIAEFAQPAGRKVFVHDRLGESIPSDCSLSGRDRKNSHHHALWAFRIPIYEPEFYTPH